MTALEQSRHAAWWLLATGDPFASLKTAVQTQGFRDKVLNNSVFPPSPGEQEDCQGLVGGVTMGVGDSTVTAVLPWCDCPLVASRAPSHALLSHFHDKIRGRFGHVPHNVGDGGFASRRNTWDIASTAPHLSALHYLLATVPFALSSHPPAPKRLL